jgi:hypothetical protein
VSHPGRWWLVAAASASGATALLHVAIALAGAPGYRYFGAPSLAVALESGSLAPPVLTLGLAAAFVLCAAYGLSGAGLLRHLPLLRPVLLVIGSVFALRGLMAVPESLALLHGSLRYPRALVFSSVALVIGACYLMGLAAAWRRLTPPNGATATQIRV